MTIQCRAIVEVVGKPESYVKESIEAVKKAAADINGVKILETTEEAIDPVQADSKVKEKTIQKVGEIFSTFTEITFEAKTVDDVASFCFELLPASIEFESPEQITMTQQELNNIFNDVMGKLHNADNALKEITFRNRALDKNSKLLLRNMIMISLKAKPMNKAEISKAIGIPEDNLTAFLDALVQDKFITLNGDMYEVNKQ